MLQMHQPAISYHRASVKHKFGTDSKIIDVLATSCTDGYSAKSFEYWFDDVKHQLFCSTLDKDQGPSQNKVVLPV